MSHLHPDTLTLRALGEESESAGGHLADCGTCSTDLASLRRTVAAGRAIDRSERVPAAPAHGRNGDGCAPPTDSDAPATPDMAWAGSGALVKWTAPGAGGDGRPPAGPRSRARASKRRRTTRVMAALMGAVALAAIAAFVLTSSRPRVVAEVALDALEGSSVAGSAQLVERDGAFELRVDFDPTTDTDRYYELWLLDTSGDRLVSLGPVVGDGVHPLPAGLTVADYPVVDVSSERFDRDPRHSGDSLSRGTLPV